MHVCGCMCLHFKMISRKAQRKQDRLEKKQKRHLFYQHQKGHKNIELNNNNQQQQTNKSTETGQNSKKKNEKSKKRKNEASVKKYKKSRFEQERDAKFIRDEEKTIKRYERLLKLKSYTKKNRLPKSFYMDGLGELIEFCEKKQYDNRVVLDPDDDEYWSAKLKRSTERTIASTKDQNNTNCDEDENIEMEDNFDDSEQELQSEEEFETETDDDDDDEDDDEKEEEETLSQQISDEENSQKQFVEELQNGNRSQKVLAVKKEVYREDIYGRLIDQYGNVVTQSKPTTKETILNTDIVVDESLQRKLCGLLNRLTADNIKSISKEIIELYKRNSRAMVNKAIWIPLEKTLIEPPYTVPAKLVSEMSLLIAILYSDIGEEVGGFFIHTVVCRFETAFKNVSQWQSNKRLDNIVVLLLNLYATGLLDSVLVYDILDQLCDQFSEEKCIELLDIVLKAVGFLLRKDDPAKMKSLIGRIQTLSSSVDCGGLSGTRIKFILESLTAIKNNNIAKLKVTEPVVMNELIEETLKGVLKKHRVPCMPGAYAAVIQSAHWFSFTKTIVPLNPLNKRESNEDNSATSATVSEMMLEQNVDLELRDRLCRTLRINTPLRKDLFTVLLQCQDYLETACKLISIGKKQFSEVINIVVHVAIHEKSYNHYYFHLLHHLTTCDRKYKLALDFALRDKIGQITTFSENKQTNLAQLIYNLLKGGTLSITCLKVVQFADMNEIYVHFIRQILEPIFTECDAVTIENILSKIPKKDNFASAIKLFVTCFMNADYKHRMSTIKQLQFKVKI